MYRTLTYKTERDEDNLAGADDGCHGNFYFATKILARNQQL